MHKIKRILAPTDCSEQASDAIIYATEISEKFSADLIVLRVFTSPAETYEEGILIRDYSYEIKPEQLGEIENFWNQYAGYGRQPECIGLIGDPFNEIIGYSNENAIDMIVMGTHGYTGFKHIFMGSVAEKVVRYSMVPVLTVKQKSFEYCQAGR